MGITQVEKKIKCESKLSSKKLFAYGSDKPLTVAGSFIADVYTQKKCVTAEFFVVEERGQPLLGHKTATQLGILQIQENLNTSHVNFVESNSVPKDLKTEMKQQFPKVFNGIGKLNNFQLKIPISDSVQPVIQPVRRVPYNLRGKLEEKLKELEKLDIIEKVDGPSAWVSPIVVVPKKNSDIRVCVDMI